MTPTSVPTDSGAPSLAGVSTPASAPLDSLTSTLLNSIEDGVVIYDTQFRYQVFNRAMERLTGMRAADVLGRCPFDIFPQLRTLGVDELVQRAMNGETVRSGELPYHIPGTDRSGWTISQYSPIVHVDGSRVGVVGVIRDVTQSRRAADALRRSEEWFRSLIEYSWEMVLVLGADGTTRYVSPSVLRFLGGQTERVLGTSIFAIVHPADFARVRAEFQRLVERRGDVTPLEFRCRHQDGGWRTITISARNLLHEPAVRGIVVHARDVTEQRTLQQHVQQSLKMEAIGRLAGGVAHDFNNLLTVIQGNVQLALMSPETVNPAAQELTEIGMAAEKAAVLTRQLLTFARQQPSAVEELHPNAVVEGIAPLLERVVGRDVELVLALQPATGSVRADRGQLEQVLMNLVVNSRDAMPEGGVVVIHTCVAEVSPEEARLHPGVKPGPYVVLSVNDSGEGMSEAVRARIFEPFFTTKDSGKGTGLGLPTVYAIVEQAGGFLRVESELRRGTSMQVYLPRTDS